MAERNEVNTPVIAMIGLISTLLFVASVILLEVVFFRVETDQLAAKDASPPLELTNLVHAQQAQLADYRWVDEKKGVVAIPISRAMEMVVARLASGSEQEPKNEDANEHPQ